MANNPSSSSSSSKSSGSSGKYTATLAKGKGPEVNGITGMHMPAHMRRVEQGEKRQKGKWSKWTDFVEFK